ncbi:MAG: DMT family transporter [Clostridia bacterium]|nr:DMT family transporter [Clostridia bacterium]
MSFLKKNKTLLLALLVMLLWGSLFPMVKLGFSAFSVVSTGDILFFAGLRFVICGAVITVFAFVKDKKSFVPVRHSLFPLLLSGLFAIVLHYACTYLGLSLTESGKTAILKQVAALLYVLASPLFFREDKITAGKVIGALLGFLGVIAMNWSEGSIHFGLGEVLILLASVCTVASNVISKRLFEKVDPITATGCSQFFGGAVLLIVGVAMGGGVKLAKSVAIPIFIYILAASIVSYCLWYTIVKTGSLSSLFVIKFAEPLFSCILGAVILGENIFDLRYLFAFLLIGGGITVANLAFAKKKEKE